MRTRTRHPDPGALRRLVDEPAGVLDVDRDHVAGCPPCLADLARTREDADRAATVFAPRGAERAHDTDAADLEQAWQRLTGALRADGTGGTSGQVSRIDRRRRRRALRSPALAAVGVAAVLTGASAAAAGDWIRVFRTEQVAVPGISRAELVALPEPEELDAFGDLAVLAEPDVRPVDDAAAAAEATGLAVPGVAALPRGVAGEPTLQVLGPVAAEFTFDAEEARDTLAADGEQLPTLPDGLDGATFRLSAGPGHAAVWQSGSGAPALVVARAVAPTVHSSGVPFDTAVDYLAGVPGVPPELVGELDRFAGGTTLPLPFADDEVRTRTEDVGGRPATVVTSRDGTFAGVVQVRDGVATVVAGTLGADEVLAVARGLREP
ncbi:hypothetical protein [Aquipuribacter sp. SD81]|uniref:hypothetical protein n=1 Tax=Aquipuribacter sp. SD81 TaxID=3127703 RepID=UPI00301A9CBF